MYTHHLNNLAADVAVSGRGEICDEDVDCNEKNNERCQKYDACLQGTCVCKEGYSIWSQCTAFGCSAQMPPTGLAGVCLPGKLEYS